MYIYRHIFLPLNIKANSITLYIGCMVALVPSNKETRKRKNFAQQMVHNIYATLTSLGITLIEIPYWWDCKIESLAATIHKYKPDLIQQPKNATPIPDGKEYANTPLPIATELSVPMKLELHKEIL
jgi:hypothetical protein